MPTDANRWANQKHTELLRSDEWVTRFPDPVERDKRLYYHILKLVEAEFGYICLYPLEF